VSIGLKPDFAMICGMSILPAMLLLAAARSAATHWTDAAVLTSRHSVGDWW